MDGTIVIEDTDIEGAYWYVMCYAEEILESLGWNIWYEAGEDLLDCIETASYDFDIEYDDMIQLTPSCESYGDTLYEYVGDIVAVTATTQSVNDELDPRGEVIDTIQDTSTIPSGSGDIAVDWWRNTWKYGVFALLLILFGLGVYQVSKK